MSSTSSMRSTRSAAAPASACSQPDGGLFNHLVCASEQGGWNSEAERLRGL
jgi:hypothetical protein